MLTKRQQYRRAHYQQNKKRIAQQNKEWTKNHPERKAEMYRRHHYKKWYGITYQEYDQILEFQKGVCAICGRAPSNRRLHTDHKHQKGEKQIRKKNEAFEKIRPLVRGLLCWRCNLGLQRYYENPTLLRNAADYLEQLPAQQILGKNNNEDQTNN